MSRMPIAQQPLTSKDLVEKAFRGEKTSRIPVNHRGFSSKAASYILGHEAFVGGGIQRWREAKSLHEGWHDEFLERSFKDATEIARTYGSVIVGVSNYIQPETPPRNIDALLKTIEENRGR